MSLLEVADILDFVSILIMMLPAQTHQVTNVVLVTRGVATHTSRVNVVNVDSSCATYLARYKVLFTKTKKL